MRGSTFAEILAKWPDVSSEGLYHEERDYKFPADSDHFLKVVDGRLPE